MSRETGQVARQQERERERGGGGEGGRGKSNSLRIYIYTAGVPVGAYIAKNAGEEGGTRAHEYLLSKCPIVCVHKEGEKGFFVWERGGGGGGGGGRRKKTRPTFDNFSQKMRSGN